MHTIDSQYNLLTLTTKNIDQTSSRSHNIVFFYFSTSQQIEFSHERQLPAVPVLIWNTTHFMGSVVVILASAPTCAKESYSGKSIFPYNCMGTFLILFRKIHTSNRPHIYTVDSIHYRLWARLIADFELFTTVRKICFQILRNYFLTFHRYLWEL